MTIAFPHPAATLSPQPDTAAPCIDGPTFVTSVRSSFEIVSSTGCFVKMDFPTDVAEFYNDPRISFTRLDNSFLPETSGGREFLFNSIATTYLRLHSRPLNAPPRQLHPLWHTRWSCLPKSNLFPRPSPEPP